MENILLPKVIIFFQIVFIDIVMAADNAIIIGLIASSFAAKITLKRKAPKTPSSIILFLSLEAKEEAIKPIMIALSAAMTTSIIRI